MHSVIHPRPAKAIPLPPDDPALPELRRLLDLDLVAARLIDERGQIVERSAVRTERLVYRPGAACEAVWSVDVEGVRRLVVGTVSRGPLADHPDPVLGAVIRWFPNDPALPALGDIERLGAMLARLGLGIPDDASPDVLSYRPGERAVLGFGPAVVKAFTTSHEAQTAQDAGEWARGVLGEVASAPLLTDPGICVTVQHRLTGRQLDHDDVATAATEGGEVLRALHGGPVWGGPTRTDADVLAQSVVAAGLIRTILPELADRVERLVTHLRESAPSHLGLVPSHGDFNVSQIIRTQTGEIRVLDFDDRCMASPSLDMASYIANAISGRDGDLAIALDAREVLLDAYGAAPADLTWHVVAAVLRRAPSPFRLQKRTWPERVTRIVEAAEAVCAP